MNGKRAGQGGLTLLEMLVVFLLVALLSTLLIQGVGYFLGQYQAVQRFQGRITEGLTTYTWFSESVEAIIPYTQTARQFHGDGHTLRGFTMQALAAEPGMPVEMSWTIVESEEGNTAFEYQEENQELWMIPALPGTAKFEYADADLNWHSVWPPSDKSLARVPHMIRLKDGEQEVIWLVKLLFHPRPIEDHRVPL